MCPGHHRRMHQLRRLRARVPERGDLDGRDDLRHRPAQVHRVRRPLRRAAVRAGLPGRLHSARPGATSSRTRRSGPSTGACRPRRQASSRRRSAARLPDPRHGRDEVAAVVGLSGSCASFGRLLRRRLGRRRRGRDAWAGRASARAGRWRRFVATTVARHRRRRGASRAEPPAGLRLAAPRSAALDVDAPSRSAHGTCEYVCAAAIDRPARSPWRSARASRATSDRSRGAASCVMAP